MQPRNHTQGPIVFAIAIQFLMARTFTRGARLPTVLVVTVPLRLPSRLEHGMHQRRRSVFYGGLKPELPRAWWN